MLIEAGFHKICKHCPMVQNLSSFQRLILVKRALKNGENLSVLCRQLKISRTLANRLIRRYTGSSGKLASIIANQNDKNCVQKVSEMRLYILNKVLIEGLLVSKTCREFGISRTIFYRWLNRYKAASSENKLVSLEDKNTKNNLVRSRSSNTKEIYAD